MVANLSCGKRTFSIQELPHLDCERRHFAWSRARWRFFPVSISLQGRHLREGAGANEEVRLFTGNAEQV
jgi:hypothetical protein